MGRHRGAHRPAATPRDDADALRLFELPPPEPESPESALARKQNEIRCLVAELLAEPDEWDE